MQQVIIKNPAAGTQNVSSPSRRINPPTLATDLEIDLGIWIAAIESFVGTTGHPFADRVNLRGQDWTGDLNLTISGLILCSTLASQLTTSALTSGSVTELPVDELDSLSDVLSDALNVGTALSRSKPISFSEWRSWCRLVAENFHSSPELLNLYVLYTFI